MTGSERILVALKAEQPDQVPIMELPASNIREVLLPGGSVYDAIEYFDLDGVDIDDRGYSSYNTEIIDSQHRRNQWGTLVRMMPGTLPHPLEGAVKTEHDLDSWIMPDVDEPARYKLIQEMVRRYKGQRAIVASFPDPFTIANEVRGATDHFLDFVRNPDFIDRLSSLICDYYIKYIHNCVTIGVDAIWVKGDYATTKWPMLSREHFIKHVIPVLKSLVDEAHQLGVPVMKHTDGNIMPIIDLIINTGINGLHPIDPNAGMDLGEIKRLYGDQICLMGNVDCASILTWGSTDDVRNDVKRCMLQAAKGGGYICMSSNSIHSSVKPENYVAMIRAAREYGQYPLSF